VSQFTTKGPAHTCLLQYYLKQSSYRNYQGAPLLTNGLRKCGICIHVIFYNPTSLSPSLEYERKPLTKMMIWLIEADTHKDTGPQSFIQNFGVQ
jgi:hypothetical protein